MAVEVEQARESARAVDVERGLVSRRIFADPAIYQQELEQIFARCWLYLAHDRQLPRPGDFLGAVMGEEAVLVTRAGDGQVHAFLNTCRHRGNRVCRADQGRATAFVCPCHGWTYDNTGRLSGVPGYKELYHAALDRKHWGPVPVAQVASYKGLIFGTFDPQAPPLAEYLGDMRWDLDLLLEQGELVAVPGIARWTMECNWKFAADNAIGDMYHGGIAHRSALLAGHSGASGVRGNSLGSGQQGPGFSVITEYGYGFNANLVNPASVQANNPLAYWRQDRAVQERLGPLRSKVNRANLNVFHNLFVNSGSRQLMLRNPQGPTQTVI